MFKTDALMLKKADEKYIGERTNHTETALMHSGESVQCVARSLVWRNGTLDPIPE